MNKELQGRILQVLMSDLMTVVLPVARLSGFCPQHVDVNLHTFEGLNDLTFSVAAFGLFH
jgi:hypothetical protein